MFGNFTTKLYLKWIEHKGFLHGNNFSIEKGANVDSGFCGFISCGNNVTLAKDVYLLAHDASMKKTLGKTKVGRIVIGNNVFIGAKTVVLPGVEIGDNVVIGANSTVTKSIPAGEVWAGTPARFIGFTKDFMQKHQDKMNGKSYSQSEVVDVLENDKYTYID